MLELEQDTGLEPVTFSLATRHSTTELILLTTIYSANCAYSKLYYKY